MYNQYVDKFNNIYEAVPQGKVFRIMYDDVTNNLRIVSRDTDAFEELQDSFSVKNTAAFFSERYGYSPDKKLYAINKFGFFSPGLIFEILQWIKLHYGDLSVVAMSQNCKAYICDILMPLKSLIIDKFEIANIAEDSGINAKRRRNIQQKIKLGLQVEKKDLPFDFRDYQIESIKELLFTGYGRGLIEVPTAGGKSLIIANVIWNIWKNIDKEYKALIFVPNAQLVAQFYSDLIEYGFDQRDIAKFTGGMSKKERAANDLNKSKIIIANRQQVFKNKNAIPKVDILIADEVHTAIADSTKEFIEGLDTKIKIGCSGTIPRDQFKRWQTIGLFGKIVYVEEITKLQEQGFISKLEITLLKIRDKEVDKNTKLPFSLNTEIKFDAEAVANGESDVMFNDAYIAEKEYFNRYYKELYKPVFEYLKTLNSNTLLLFDRIEIGTNLYNYAKDFYTDKNVYYIDGSIRVDNREEIRKLFEKSDGNLLIAQNAVMSTGVNIRRLTNLVFLTSSKSFSRTIQSIGRTLRLHESKDKAHLIDISWNTKYSQKHLTERLKIYKTMYNKRPDNIIDLDLD